MSDIINIGLSVYPQKQAKKTQSVNIVHKEISRMKTNWKKVSYCVSRIVLFGCVSDCIAVRLNGQSLVSANRSLPKTYIPGEPVKIKGDELIKPAAK